MHSQIIHHKTLHQQLMIEKQLNILATHGQRLINLTRLCNFNFLIMHVVPSRA